MHIYRPGTTVETESGIKVLILEAHICGGCHVDYVISYWEDGKRYQLTVPEFELKHLADCEIIEIGFHTLAKGK